MTAPRTQITMAHVVERYYSAGYIGYSDRSLLALKNGTSVYHNKLYASRPEKASYYKVMCREKEGTRPSEALFTIVGIITEQTLPLPYNQSDRNTRPGLHMLRQHILLSGFGSDSFSLSIDGCDEVYRQCERDFPAGGLLANNFAPKRQGDGRVIQATNRCFTDLNHDKNATHVGFTEYEDPQGILTDFVSEGTHVRSSENIVQYYLSTTGIAGDSRQVAITVIYLSLTCSNFFENRGSTAIRPTAVRKQDIVELTIAFSIFPKGDLWRLMPVLKTVTLLEKTIPQTREIPRAPQGKLQRGKHEQRTSRRPDPRRYASSALVVVNTGNFNNGEASTLDMLQQHPASPDISRLDPLEQAIAAISGTENMQLDAPYPPLVDPSPFVSPAAPHPSLPVRSHDWSLYSSATVTPNMTDRATPLSPALSPTGLSPPMTSLSIFDHSRTGMPPSSSLFNPPSTGSTYAKQSR